MKHKYGVVSEYKSEDNYTKSKSTESSSSALELTELNPEAGFTISNGNGYGSSNIGLDVRSSTIGTGTNRNEPRLQCDENMDFDDQENKPENFGNIEETEEVSCDRLNQLNHKTSTAVYLYQKENRFCFPMMMDAAIFTI